MSMVALLTGQQGVVKSSPAVKRSLEKLSAGLRTKAGAADSTSGLASGADIRARISGIERALTSTQEGMSMMQAASSALEQTQEMLGRMRELTVQASGDALTQQDRGYMQAELNGIRDEITGLAENTRFGRKSILNGDNAILWSTTDKKVRAVIHGGLRSAGSLGEKYAVDGDYELDITAEEAGYNVTVKDAHNGAVIAENMNAEGGRLSGVIHRNIDVEISPDYPGGTVMLHVADNTSIFQTGTGVDVMLSIGDMRSDALGLDGVNVMSREASEKSTALIDRAADMVSMQQAGLGASLKRLHNHAENLKSEVGAFLPQDMIVRDTARASEILETAKADILSQPDPAMLSQANQVQQNVLMLFRG